MSGGIARHRALVVIVIAAAALFTANTYHQSLLPLDDCFYARKGVEMRERGFSFTVTWNGNPNHQNPPLPFWVLGASFGVFGANDLAARLPSVLMALGIVLLAYRIGSMLLGRDAALVGVALLLLCPIFVQNARRCMLEVPNAFWVTLALWVGLESRGRPRCGIWLSVPLAAAALTKSVLGLLPLVVLAGVAWHRDGRRIVANAWLCAGAALGLVGAAIWPMQQGLTAGWDVVRSHFLGEIGGRAVGALSPIDLLFDYPLALLREFQPAVVPGCIGVVLALLRHRTDVGRVFLATWVLLPLIVCSLASARSARYVFPILVPLALLAGDLFVRWQRRATLLAATRIVPVILVTAALVFWVRPSWLTRDQSAVFKRRAADIQRLVPAGHDVPLWGTWSWRLASPFVYYAERGLIPHPEASLQQALALAAALPVPCLLVPRERLPHLGSEPAGMTVVADLGDWLLLAATPPASSLRLGNGLAVP